MTCREAVDFLLQGSYLLRVNGQLVICQKLYNELGLNQQEERVEEVNKGLVVINSKVAIRSKSVKQNYTDEEAKNAWNNLCEHANIPHRVSPNGSGTYTVRQYNAKASDKLIVILSNPNLDKKKFIDSTASYYKTVSYPLTLSRYLLDDNWMSEYKAFGLKQTNTNDGSSRFET